MSEAVRCFVAVKIPEAAAARVRDAQERLREVEPSWKWVSPDRLEKLWPEIGAALSRRPPFTMTLEGLGAFPDTRSPRVAWAGIERGAEELRGLAEDVEAACECCGFERERRPFTAHLTLGRARRGQTKSQVGRAIEQDADIAFGEALIDRVLLMRSQLSPDGARYTVLEEHQLKHGEAE
jgi:2'-5' RNA ligase